MTQNNGTKRPAERTSREMQSMPYSEDQCDLFSDWFQSLRIADVCYSFLESVDDSFCEEFFCDELKIRIRVKTGSSKNMSSGESSLAVTGQVAVVVGNGYLVTESFSMHF